MVEIAQTTDAPITMASDVRLVSMRGSPAISTMPKKASTMPSARRQPR